MLHLQVAQKTTILILQVLKLVKKYAFALLAEEPFMFYELWGNHVNDPEKRKPFRFAEEPTPEDITEKLGDDFVRSLSRDGKHLNEPCRIAHAVPVYNYDWNVYKFSLGLKKLSLNSLM